MRNQREPEERVERTVLVQCLQDQECRATKRLGVQVPKLYIKDKGLQRLQNTIKTTTE